MEERREYFSDMVWLHINPWSAMIRFGTRATRKGEDDVEACAVRMPLEQAKVLAILLRRLIRNYEEKGNLTIDLPQDVLSQLQIPPEDWKRFSGES